jgi:hypothetical protein
MVLPSLFFVDNMLYVGSNDAIEKEFEDSVRNRFDVKFRGPAKWFLQMHIPSTKTKATPLINITTFLTPYNITIQTRNSLNVKLHSRLITLSATITDQSLIMTSTSLKNNTNAFPSAPPFVRYSISPTTRVPIFSLQFANLRKPVSALAKPTSVPLSGL